MAYDKQAIIDCLNIHTRGKTIAYGPTLLAEKLGLDVHGPTKGGFVTALNKMVEAEDKTKTGIEIAANLIKELKGICQGVHLMAIGWEKKVPAILDAAGM